MLVCSRFGARKPCDQSRGCATGAKSTRSRTAATLGSPQAEVAVMLVAAGELDIELMDQRHDASRAKTTGTASSAKGREDGTGAPERFTARRADGGDVRRLVSPVTMST